LIFGWFNASNVWVFRLLIHTAGQGEVDQKKIPAVMIPRFPKIAAMIFSRKRGNIPQSNKPTMTLSHQLLMMISTKLQSYWGFM